MELKEVLSILYLFQPLRADPSSQRSRSSAFKDILKKPFHRSRGSTGANGSESPTSTPPTPTRATTEEPLIELPAGGGPNSPTERSSEQNSLNAATTKTNGVAELVSAQLAEFTTFLDTFIPVSLYILLLLLPIRMQ